MGNTYLPNTKWRSRVLPPVPPLGTPPPPPLPTPPPPNHSRRCTRFVTFAGAPSGCLGSTHACGSNSEKGAHAAAGVAHPRCCALKYVVITWSSFDRTPHPSRSSSMNTHGTGSVSTLLAIPKPLPGAENRARARPAVQGDTLSAPAKKRPFAVPS
jgi:hypothetical protein